MEGITERKYHFISKLKLSFDLTLSFRLKKLEHTYTSGVRKQIARTRN